MKRTLSIIIGISFLCFFAFITSSISRKIESSTAPTGHIIIKDRKWNILTLLPKNNGFSLPYSWNLDTKIVKSIIDIEDKRFYSHFGIDILSKWNVLSESIWAGRFTRWWSTITEQYVKNAYFPNAGRTISQKIREWIWAIIVEWRYSKKEILKKYLETVYMGNGIYGIPAAISSYFPEQNLENLSDEGIAEIITRLRFPNWGGSSDEYKKQIIQKLWLNASQNIPYKNGKITYINLFPFLTQRIQKEIQLFCRNEKSELHEFIENIPKNICTSSFIDITSSIDLELSNQVLSALEAVIYPLEEKNVHNGAIFVWSEKEQKILAYIWNRNDATGNSYDMIGQRRSVGSVLKPFLYLIALHSRDPNDLILDEAKVYGNSLNSAAVRLAESIGIGRVYSSFRSLGLTLDHDASYYGYGLVLWAPELSLENVVSAYRNVVKLTDAENFLLYNILSDPANRSMTFWQSSILNTSIPLAVKTGTSTDFHDNWALGYNDDIIIWVWVGNTDGSSMTDVSWVTGAWPIFHKVAEELIRLGYIKAKSYPIPKGVIENYLCRDENCYQKEISFTHSWYVRKSRPASKLFYETDFITPLTQEEKKHWKIQ